MALFYALMAVRRTLKLQELHILEKKEKRGGRLGLVFNMVNFCSL